MGSIAAALIVFGFGTLLLNQFGMTFRILSWADPYQPGLGIGMGVLGLILLVVSLYMKRGSAAETETAQTGREHPEQ